MPERLEQEYWDKGTSFSYGGPWLDTWHSMVSRAPPGMAKKPGHKTKTLLWIDLFKN